MTFERDLQTRAQLRQVLESAGVNFFALDRNYCYSTFNRLHAETILAIWGIKIAAGMDMLNQVIGESQDRAKAKSNFDRAFAGEEFVLMEAYGDVALTRRFYESRYSPERNEEHQVVGVIVFVTDVSERVRLAEDRLALDNKMQEAATLESLGLLAGGIAHDINNLLVPIVLSTDLAFHKLGADHPVAERLLTIREAARQAAELTKQLLAFSSDGWASPELTDLNSVVIKTSELAKISVGRRTDLVINPTATPLPVYVDPVQIRQVITNLLINASEASVGRSDRITMETSLMHVSGAIESDALIPEVVADGDYAILTVKDSGRGMTADQLEHIFELFYSSKGSGRGFGLAATQAIVRKHQGFIAIDSTVGEGTTFRVGIPLMSSESGAYIQTAEINASGRVENIVGPLRILIADTDARIRTTLALLCKSDGHEVMTAGRGEDVLRILSSEAPFDVLFVDEGLHDMSSDDIARGIAAENPTPMVLMSGFRKFDNVLTQQPRIRQLLCKPFNADAFRLVLQNFSPAQA